MQTVAVLFARADSVYKQLPGTDVYDMERDARIYDGPHPVVAHPPCRAWGRLRSFANPRPDERNLARLAVAMVREFGGVLEHPAGSTLWSAQGLPPPENAMRSAGGRWQHLRNGGAIERRKRHGFTWSDANPATCQACPIQWPRQHTLSKAASARTAGHTSQKQSESTHRPSWPCGWSNWPADAPYNPSPPSRAFSFPKEKPHGELD